MPRHLFVLLVLASGPVFAKPPIQPEDIYKLEGPQSVTAAPDGRSAVYIRRWVDPETNAERFSLWRVDGPDKRRPLEAGEPDARAPVYSPDGQWIAIRSTRPHSEGWNAIPSVPLESDPATDIWLVAADGSRVIPLAGPGKSYGRVFLDPFYGRVAFSPDGKRLLFVADDGRDLRTPSEREAGVEKIREDQGEGYTGFQAAQIWIADLAERPALPAKAAGSAVGAASVRRLTDDEVWYGDPQWTSDGKAVICHANKTADFESVRYSINKNYDLWRIDVETGEQTQLTTNIGPDVSPRISPDGSLMAWLSVPRQGPHSDVYNIAVRALRPDAVAVTGGILLDAHSTTGPVAPMFPLADDCWDVAGGKPGGIVYTGAQGLKAATLRIDLASGATAPFEWTAAQAEQSPAARRIVAAKTLTPPANTILNDRLLGEDKAFAWKNGDLALDGALTVPPPEVGKAPYPLVVFPHGGPHGRIVVGFNLTAQFLAGQGFLVFQPNFRGSTGYGREFLDADRKDLGGGDMRDILSGIDALVKEGLADPDRQFVYGVSYGGFMTTWLVGHTSQFKAAVAQNAVTHMDVMWGVSDLQSWLEWELGGKPWDVPDKMRQHSPYAYLDKVATPTLILHSREDRRCPFPMGKMFYTGLQARGVASEMIAYPNEGHGIKQPRHQVDVLKRILAWFRRHDPKTVIEIVTLGDSITRGARPGVTPAETFANRLETILLEKGHPVRVTNVGIGGERTDGALARLDKDVISRKPRIVTIMYGTNDSYVDKGHKDSRLSVETYTANLKSLVEKLRAAGAVPVLMTEPRWGPKARNGLDENPNPRLEKYLDACRAVAKELSVPLVDHYAHWQQAESAGQSLGAWTTDQCHPNSTGHRILTETMLPIIEQVLSQW